MQLPETVSKWHWIVYPWAVFEDLSGFAEKVLREGERTAPEIIDRLGLLYGISVDPEMLDEALCVLAGMGKITEMDGKYTSIHG